MDEHYQSKGQHAYSYAVYECLARDGPGFALAHCWAHTKRKFEVNATDWPTACGEIDKLMGDLYAVERLVPCRFPGDAAAQALRHQLRQDRSRLIADRIKTWATEQVGLPNCQRPISRRSGGVFESRLASEAPQHGHHHVTIGAARPNNRALP